MGINSKVDIYNLALSHLGIGVEVSTPTEKSKEAQALSRYYDTAIDVVLRSFPWPFATKIATLNLIEQDPNEEWDYSYLYPNDCRRARRILSGNRNDSRKERVSYKIFKGSGSSYIYTDMENAQLEYTLDIDLEGYFPTDFALAVSFLLAAYTAPRLTGGDPFKMGERALRMYEYHMSIAQADSANEEQRDMVPESEFITSRD